MIAVHGIFTDPRRCYGYVYFCRPKVITETLWPRRPPGQGVSLACLDVTRRPSFRREVVFMIKIARKGAVVASASLALCLAAAACSSSSSSSSPRGGSSSSASSSSGATVSISVAQFTRDFSAMSVLKPLAAAGKGNVAVNLPDTGTSARYVQFDASYLTEAATA